MVTVWVVGEFDVKRRKAHIEPQCGFHAAGRRVRQLTWTSRSPSPFKTASHAYVAWHDIAQRTLKDSTSTLR